MGASHYFCATMFQSLAGLPYKREFGGQFARFVLIDVFAIFGELALWRLAPLKRYPGPPVMLKAFSHDAYV